MGTWAKNGNFTKEYIGGSAIFPKEAPLTKSEKIFFEKALAENTPTDSMFRDMDIERIKTKPLEVLKTYFIRFPLLWSGTRFDIFELNKTWFPREKIPWYLIKLSFYGMNLSLMLLGLFGIVVVWRKKNPLIFLSIPIIYTSIVYLPFASFENRYSQPVYPFVLLYAGIAFSMIFKRNSSKIIN